MAAGEKTVYILVAEATMCTLSPRFCFVVAGQKKRVCLLILRCQQCAIVLVRRAQVLGNRLQYLATHRRALKIQHIVSGLKVLMNQKQALTLHADTVCASLAGAC